MLQKNARLVLAWHATKGCTSTKLPRFLSEHSAVKVHHCPCRKCWLTYSHRRKQILQARQTGWTRIVISVQLQSTFAWCYRQANGVGVRLHGHCINVTPLNVLFRYRLNDNYAAAAANNCTISNYCSSCSSNTLQTVMLSSHFASKHFSHI